ncbi:SpoIVB peptidase [Caproiciproducens sp. CPB-2]|uniref:SpoIVB peptidase n=1 Tax=Caproiciproducens sp. CPB-2 TaxID=3030017 RepID=UPI0023D9E93D|nr:SpoIVB peptidase [Caproiciproducens sp. CPB-2]MDF1495896.1 SpoIVB peptidase [Caproiciproducens sp. CPB-2]
MKKFLKGFTAFAAVLAFLYAASVGMADYFTPDSYKITAGSSLQWGSDAITAVAENGADISTGICSTPNKSYKAKLMLYHVIPIKTVSVNVVKETLLVPCGTPFGIKMFTNGVVVVGVADIKTSSGTINPAAVAGLKVGDIITEVDGKKVNTNAEIIKMVTDSDGRSLTFTVSRDGQVLTTTVQPVKSEVDSVYRAGVWLRDSTAGIGTLTFYNPVTKCFAGLGHGVCDTDTNELMPLLNGDIVPVTISGITKGEKGSPGELRGYFSTDTAMGTLEANVPAGVYGTLNTAPKGEALEVAMKQEIKAGPVKILSTIDGGRPQYFTAEIEKIDYRENVQSKNMVLHITDEKLLNATGGIVQGMSGSPVIQNDKIIGAVTHVFVNDPTRGYGIFAENMLSVSESIRSNDKQKAS